MHSFFEGALARNSGISWAQLPIFWIVFFLLMTATPHGEGSLTGEHVGSDKRQNHAILHVFFWKVKKHASKILVL